VRPSATQRQIHRAKTDHSENRAPGCNWALWWGCECDAGAAQHPLSRPQTGGPKPPCTRHAMDPVRRSSSRAWALLGQ
jgi:hypothetical protein